MKPMSLQDVEMMSLKELQDEKRRLIHILIKNADVNWKQAKRFKACCDAIRYIHEMRSWAAQMNSGKASEYQASNRTKDAMFDADLKKRLNSLEDILSVARTP